ncbi:MAG: calcium/sodium antiporter [Prevotella sp.]|jgi:cation:H+ antiporter|nr:calcium/sodium antiporter [Prevotella sp.]
MTLLNIFFIIIGVTLVIWGADRLTEGAASLARGLHVPEIVIGLTILAAGTSAPELFVSLVSALKGTSDLAVGNVIGSNIFNAMLIVGCSAVAAPMAISHSTVSKDIPFALIASILMFLLCFDDMNSPHLWGNEISRSDGMILLVVFVAFMIYTFNKARKDGMMPDEYYDDEEKQPVDKKLVWKNVLWMVIGLACLIYGSNLFVDAASYVAYRFGVRQSVVGLTIVAGGTSLPELATSVMAARKGQSALAIGNAIGSNVFNILLILGTTAVICPMRIMGINIIDLSMMIISMGLLWLFAYTKYTVSRREGFLLIGGFLAYMAWLFYLL